MTWGPVRGPSLAAFQVRDITPAVVVPEPLTVLAVFGGVATLTRYVRKRRSA
jgi:hypothetical protein